MGILDNLMGPEAAGDATDSGLVDPPDEHDALEDRAPSAVTAAMAQTVPVAEEIRADARREAGRAASTASPEGPPASREGARFVRGARPAAVEAEEGVAEKPREDPRERDMLRVATLARLEVLLKSCQWGDVDSPDSNVRAAAHARQFHLRQTVRAGLRQGLAADMAASWERHAGPDAPAFEVIARAVGNHTQSSDRVSGAANDGDFSGKDPGQDPPEKHSAEQPPSGESSLLALPINAVAAAGSLVLASLGKAVHVSHRHYVQKKVNGHAILAGQIEQSAARVAELADELKGRGLGGLMKAMDETGRPSSEVIAGMDEGGPHEDLGQRLDGLMTRPEVAAGYGQLNDELDRFAHLSKRYGKVGADLNLDTDGPVESGRQQMAEALEGLPMKDEDGKFKLLQERLEKLMEDIRAAIQSVLSRVGLAPAP